MRHKLLLVISLAACASNGSGSPSGDNYAGTTDDSGSSDGGSGGGGSGGGSGSQTGDTPTGPTGTTASVGPYFTTPMFFNQDVHAVPKAADSDTIIATLMASGGWGNSNIFQIDFGMNVLTADASAPMRTFTPNSSFYSPDCDNTAVPIPAGGNVESNSGYTCSTGGDCHLLVYDTSTKKLYEHYVASLTSTTYSGGCLAVWDGTKAYSSQLRGDQCTSADAAGFPISPMLFTADEVAAGHIDHAIRFILPNSRVKQGYVRPATHGTNTTGGANAPSYGVHLRLRASYPVDSLPSAGAKVVARALQKYGMYHADGGQIALTAMSDKGTAAKWSGLLGARDLAALEVTDFEVVDHGAALPFGYNCVRK